MPNTKQNNEINHINKEINLLQDRLTINKKKSKSISKWVNTNRKNTSKRRIKDKSFSEKKIQNIVKNIFQNKIKHIKKGANLLQNTLAHGKKRKRLFEKGLKKIAKMQNLSQNEFNQIAEMRGQSRDDLKTMKK